MAQRENDEYDPGVEEENSQPHHQHRLHHRAQHILNQQQTQAIHVQNPRDVDTSDEDEDAEDFEFPNANQQQFTMQQQQQRMFDSTQLTTQQLLELQKQKEEEDEARQYYGIYWCFYICLPSTLLITLFFSFKH